MYYPGLKERLQEGSLLQSYKVARPVWRATSAKLNRSLSITEGDIATVGRKISGINARDLRSWEGSWRLQSASTTDVWNRPMALGSSRHLEGASTGAVHAKSMAKVLYSYFDTTWQCAGMVASSISNPPVDKPRISPVGSLEH